MAQIGRTLALAALAAFGAAPLFADAAKADPAAGKPIYNAHCARCHGRNGTARPDYAKKGAVDLNDPEWQKARTDAEIKKVIREGSEGTLMEGYAKELSAADIDAVVAYIRKLPPPAAGTGKK